MVVAEFDQAVAAAGWQLGYEESHLHGFREGGMWEGEVLVVKEEVAAVEGEVAVAVAVAVEAVGSLELRSFAHLGAAYPPAF